MTLAWAFSLVLTFSGPAPVFGRTVELAIRSESRVTCETLRRVLVKELSGYRIRAVAGECGTT